MLPASNRGNGTNLGFPDLCLTPLSAAQVTLPYLNTALHTQSQNASKVVYVAMMNALNTGSTVSSSNGDEAGKSHWTTGGSASYNTGSATVFVESMPAVTLTSVTTQNKSNCVGAVSTPGAANVLFTRRRDVLPPPGYGLPIDASALVELAECIDGCGLGEVHVDGDGRGHVCVRVFTRGMTSELAALLAGELRGVKTLTIDLRGVPGGSLEAAVRLAGRFLPAGSVIAQVHELDGDVRELRGGTGRPWSQELTLLVDEGTASAAEVFAVALRHHRRATVVGGTTVGKATVQRVITQNGETLLATVAEVRGPQGEAIDGSGL